MPFLVCMPFFGFTECDLGNVRIKAIAKVRIFGSYSLCSNLGFVFCFESFEVCNALYKVRCCFLIYGANVEGVAL